MAINFSAQFIVNEKTSTRVLRLTDTSTGFTLSKGNFIITFPDGSVASNTDFANPQITAPGGNTSVSLITDVDNTVLTGTYVITYVALNTSLNEFTKTETFDFNWEKPAKAIINDSDVVLPEVQFKDLTAYETQGSFTGVLTRNFFTTTPSTSEVGVITKTSVGDILTPVNASKYYEGIYLVRSDISVAYTHTSKSWLTVAYTDLLQETFDVREAPTQDELVALMNTYKDQIEAYKSTNPSQYEIMNEQYDLVLALYSHILARYQTNTLDGSKAILDQLLGLLPPASSYTYKATQMLPFTINFSTSLTGTGTTGTVPKFTGTTTLGDSIIRESGGMIGIAKAPTAVLDVSGTIKGTSIVKDGGSSTQFLKADGSIDANTYLTTGSAASTYQPLDADLTAIAVLAGAAGILTKVSANTWTLDTTSYQVLDADLTAIAALAGTSGFLKKTSANTWELDTTSYQVLDADLTAIAALTGTSGILIKTAANTWSLDTATYQLADADLTAIAALAGTSGLIRKTAANTYELDTSAYLTGITSGQITTALGFTPENAANKGVNNGYASLDGAGKVPSTQLPSYVDDVLEYANLAALPATGETGKIYITLDTNKIYRWTGSVYVEISSSNAVWGGITGTLSNQTDLQAALDAKQATLTLTTTGTGGPATLSGATLNIPQYEGGYASQLKHQVKLGATIAKGKAVYVSSANGTNMIVSAASNASESTSSKTIGLLETGGVTNDIVNVITEGLLAGLDTSTALAGDPVWLGTSGNLIFGLLNKPVAPAHLVFIGIVTRVQQNNGEIFVKVQNGFELNEIHDVLVGSYGTNDVLYRDTTTNLWKNASVATVLGYTPASTTQLALKADILNPVFTDNIYISGTNPRLYFTDTDTNPDYTIFVDSGVFYILNQTTGEARLSIAETGNISSGVGKSMVATSFIKRGGTSSEFLMADGSVSTGAVFNYPAIGIAVSGGGGWLTSIDDNSANWNAAYSARIASFTVSGNSGPATFSSNTLNIPTYTLAGLGGQAALSGTGFVKISGTTISYDNSTYYLASNPSGYTTNAGTVTSVSGTGTVSGLTLSGTVTGSGSLTLGGTIALASGDVTTALGFMPVSPSSLSNYLPLTGGALANTLSSGYVLSVTNNGTAADSNGLYVNIDTASTGTPFKVARGGVSLINVNYLGATVLKSTITAISFIKSSGTSSEYLMADGSVSTGPSFTYPGAGIAVSTGTAWGTSITDNSSNWNTAYSSRITSATAPLNITGTTISISQAGASANGFLSSTDWNTFNNKASTASLGNYLPLAGGTLTGALGGTSATFSDTTDITANNSTAINLVLRGRAADSVGQMEFWNNAKSTRYGYIATDSTSMGIVTTQAIPLVLGTNSTARLTIASTGAATFSSSVTFGSDLFTYVNGGIFFNGSASYGSGIFQQSGGNLALQTNGTPKLVIATTGAATFSSTASGMMFLNSSNASGPYVAWQSSGSNEFFIGKSNATGGGSGFYDIYANAAGGGLRFWTAGGNSPAMTITTGQNVGIGTTSTNYKFEVVGGSGINQPAKFTSTTTTLYTAYAANGADCGYIGNGAGLISGGGVGEFGIRAENNLIFAISNAERMRITSGGNVGIGTTSPGEKLEVINGSLSVSTNQTGEGILYGRIAMFSTGAGSSYVGYGAEIRSYSGAGIDQSDLRFYTSPSSGTTERMRITAAGNVGIGTTAPSSLLHVNGILQVGSLASGSDATINLSTNASGSPRSIIYRAATVFMDFTNTAGTAVFQLSNGGAGTFASSVTATSFFESSDNRLKTLIEDNYQSKGIESIKAKLYSKNGVTELGYYAQDVQGILPSAVTTGADGFLNLSYREVHTAKIARLEKRVEELEAQLNLV